LEQVEAVFGKLYPGDRSQASRGNIKKDGVEGTLTERRILLAGERKGQRTLREVTTLGPHAVLTIALLKNSWRKERGSRHHQGVGKG